MPAGIAPAAESGVEWRPIGPEDEARWDQVRWWRTLPCLSIHALCLGVIWVGWSWPAAALAAGAYAARMFAVTAFYHRYFSHRSFRTHRITQFVFGLLGASAAQRGPLWWAAHHRRHHRHSDRAGDLHSPGLQGLLWSHMGWLFAEPNLRTDAKATPDLTRFPELVWLDRLHVVVVLAFAAGMYGVGALLERVAPALGANGMQTLVWGFGVSTVALYHATFMINSVAHVFGGRRYETRDDSRNNWLLAAITLGEGWHNNHHFAPGAARQGFFWWEIDVTYYALLGLRRIGLIWDLTPAPARAYERARPGKASGAAP